MRRFLTMLVVVLAFAGLGACGDDDDTTQSGADDEVTTTVEGDDDTVTTKADDDFSGSGSGDFCSLLREYDKAFQDNPDFSDKEAVKTQFQALGKAIAELEKKAPAEIKAEVGVTVAAFGKFLEALAAADYDFTKVDQASVSDLDKPEVQAAGERLDRYGEEVCGVKSDSDATTTVP